MSRVGKLPVVIPQGVDVAINGETVSVKGTGGQMSLVLNSLVKIENKDGALSLIPVDESREANAMSGTMRQLVNNMVVGVSKGFEKKLSLQGVGFKATAQGKSSTWWWVFLTQLTKKCLLALLLQHQRPLKL